MKILLIDHEDSFVYNLYQELEILGARVSCLRYTRPWKDARESDPDGIVFSPGPGHPSDHRVTGLARTALETWGGSRPVLGVCLGNQLLGIYYGGQVVRAPRPVHGEAVSVRHDGSGILRDIPSPFRAARYHSLVISRRAFPQALRLSGTSADGVVMAVRHRTDPTFGVQFHPESFLTPEGPKVLANFLEEVRR